MQLGLHPCHHFLKNNADARERSVWHAGAPFTVGPRNWKNKETLSVLPPGGNATRWCPLPCGSSGRSQLSMAVHGTCPHLINCEKVGALGSIRVIPLQSLVHIRLALTQLVRPKQSAAKGA